MLFTNLAMSDHKSKPMFLMVCSKIVPKQILQHNTFQFLGFSKIITVNSMLTLVVQ